MDSSTQQTKLVVVDAASGELLRSSALPHPDGTELDPDHWWMPLEGVGGTRPVGAAALGIAAQQHTTIFLDEHGSPVRDAILWNDRRASADARALRDELGAAEWARRAGVVPDAAHPVSKLRWLARSEPENAARIASVALPHDWLTAKLLGGRGLLRTDRSDASATGYWSASRDAYDEGLLSLAFGRPLQTPAVLEPSAAAGVTRDGIVISAGCGDNAATHLGLDTQPGDAVVSVGTSTTVSVRTETAHIDTSGTVDLMADARRGYLGILVMLNGARVLGATARMLGLGVQRLDQLAADADPAAAEAVFLPYLDGERNPDRDGGSGALVGLSREAMTPGTIARAAVLGLACAIADALDAVTAICGAPRRIFLVGGGANSAALRQAVADLAGRPILWPRHREHAAFGAARQAAWALTGELPEWPALPVIPLTPADRRSWVAGARERYATAAGAMPA